MLRIQFERFGEPTEVLRVVDVSIPRPGINQVLIRMHVRPIHPSDLSIMQGRYGALPALPACPGLEGVGVIAALGEGVQGFHVGQRVVPFNSWGTWQEYVTVDGSRLLLVPDRISDEVAAQLTVNPMSAWIMLTQELQVERGEWLVQTAANSTVGRLVLQLTQFLGVKTINVVRRREQVQELLNAGADEVICSADENVVERIAQITRQHRCRQGHGQCCWTNRCRRVKEPASWWRDAPIRSTLDAWTDGAKQNDYASCCAKTGLWRNKRARLVALSLALNSAS